MLRIVCLNAGDYEGRGRDYVNILHDSVRRNLPAGFAGTFDVFTDDAVEGYHPDITLHPLPEPGLHGWWNKLALFKPGLFPNGDRIWYFDLDTLITGRLDDLMAYAGPFAILRDVYRPTGMQSSVMAWSANSPLTRVIWESWVDADKPELEGGDQLWVEKVVAPFAHDILQNLYSDAFVSYKVSRGTLPEKASVVVFHGFPRPHQVTSGWVPDVWKIGGLMRAELDTVANTAHEKLMANVCINSVRDLPWLDYADAHDGHAVIVGGGPSALASLDEIRWRASQEQSIWALNGAGAWLGENDIAVDAQIIVDARPENIRFIAPAREHLIASQCDPVLFERIRRKVTVWHSHAPGIEAELLADPRPAHLVGGGSTVGLSAMVIAYIRGYRQIHLYGFDSSLAADQHHAYPQTANEADLTVDVVAGSRKFRAAPWMVQQAQEFVGLATWLAEQGCVITVHGDGLLPHMAHDMQAHPRATGAQMRVAEILKRLPPGPVCGAEIGVFAGQMSAELLEARSDLDLYMVDAWAPDGASYTGDSGDWHAGLSRDAQDGYQQAARSAVAFAWPRAYILHMISTWASVRVADGSLDFVFIDADHSYEGVATDIAAWAPKLKPGGWLGGHDYDNPQFPKFGVRRAVDEYILASSLTLERGAHMTWFVQMPLSNRMQAYG